ncbi:MAG: ribosomal protein methyltransferase [Bacteroidetes bacterium]|nr:ribosomal protein methyltransferase [Bacteroidota bacterium]
MRYFEVRFILSEIEGLNEILQSDLCDIGFESFQDTEDGFLAYCQEDLYDEMKIKDVVINFIDNNPNITISTEAIIIEEQNWNEEWEKAYPAVLIDDYCYVHAPFHEPMENVPFNIEISPKMSFGTAHHPTTYQILQFLKNEDVKGKDVMDMGSGTGVLAILAKLKEANYVEAIDNDSWAYENALENVERNNVDVVVKLGDANTLDRNYDVFIANINRNILLQDMEKYSSHIKPSGVLFLSGFYTPDVDILVNEVKKYGFVLEKQLTKENWAALRLVKN